MGERAKELEKKQKQKGGLIYRCIDSIQIATELGKMKICGVIVFPVTDLLQFWF